IEPKPGLLIVDDRHTAATAAAFARPFNDLPPGECPLLDWQAEGFEDPCRDFQSVDISADIFKKTPLKNDFGVVGVHALDEFFRILQELAVPELRLLTPAVDGSANEFGAEVVEGADVVVPIGKLVILGPTGNEEVTHRNGPIQI